MRQLSYDSSVAIGGGLRFDRLHRRRSAVGPRQPGTRCHRYQRTLVTEGLQIRQAHRTALLVLCVQDWPSDTEPPLVAIMELSLIHI